MGMESPDNRPAVDDRRGLMAPARGEAIDEPLPLAGAWTNPPLAGFLLPDEGQEKVKT
jgi:hypothetical protein